MAAEGVKSQTVGDVDTVRLLRRRFQEEFAERKHPNADDAADAAVDALRRWDREIRPRLPSKNRHYPGKLKFAICPYFEKTPSLWQDRSCATYSILCDMRREELDGVELRYDWPFEKELAESFIKRGEVKLQRDALSDRDASKIAGDVFRSEIYLAAQDYGPDNRSGVVIFPRDMYGVLKRAFHTVLAYVTGINGHIKVLRQ